MSWEDMLDVVDEQIGGYYVQYPVSYSEVVFNHVRLEYYPVNKSLVDSRFDEQADDDGRWVYVPVWVFEQYSDGEEDGDYGAGAYSNMLIVNAVTGNIIDMKQGLRINSGELFMSLDIGVSR